MMAMTLEDSGIAFMIVGDTDLMAMLVKDSGGRTGTVLSSGTSASS